MPEPGPARRLIIYLGESDRWRGHSLYLSILETLRKAGIAGATVMRGLAGYGAHSIIRVSTVETLSLDLPITITVIDTPANIERALALVAPMVREGLITLEDVTIVKYTHRYLQPLPADKHVSEIMTPTVTTVGPDTPVPEVIELLLGKMLKAVPVIDEERRPVGIITDGDLLRKAGMPISLSVSQRLGTDELVGLLAQVSHEKTAQTIMSQPVHTVRADESLGHAVEKMLNKKLKRMPVVDADDRLVGMLSRLDVLRAVAGKVSGEEERAPQRRTGKTIGELMSPQVPVVHVHDDLVDVLQQMLSGELTRVVVLDEQDRAVGIITDGDVVARVGPVLRQNVLRALAAKVLGTGLMRGNVTARDLMSEQVLSAPPETTVVQAVAMMIRHGRKRLVVVDEQSRPVGIVDRQTLLAAVSGR
jgi:CBS-domain-containing membrane protein